MNKSHLERRNGVEAVGRRQPVQPRHAVLLIAHHRVRLACPVGVVLAGLLGSVDLGVRLVKNKLT